LKLHLESATAKNAITGYGEGYVMVNKQRIEKSVVVLPDRIISDWAATTFEALAPEHLAALADLGCEIILLGTGNQLRFPRPEIMRPIAQSRAGLEVMDVQAACRTYNILLAEEQATEAAAGPIAITIFMLIFFGACALYAWLTWRNEKKDREAKTKSERKAAAS